MNKMIIILLAVMLFLTSCDPLLKSKQQRLTDTHYIINPTGKRMLHELTFGVPLENRDSTLCYYSTGANTQEELEWKISYAVGMGQNTQAVIGYEHPFCLYNIDDTTFLLWDKYWKECDSLFCPFYWISEGTICGDKECDRRINLYLMVSDSLLSLMQKDYTMPEKFKEYYEGN
ncbi:MAG: hypothetical protein LBD59_00185 [Prevotellaceae bacterium]|jgi:hypothetical protein|nr:hypothetical protein [Prevotellaceae bacterium]